MTLTGKVKHEWSHTSIPLHAFAACTGITLPSLPLISETYLKQILIQHTKKFINSITEMITARNLTWVSLPVARLSPTYFSSSLMHASSLTHLSMLWQSGGMILRHMKVLQTHMMSHNQLWTSCISWTSTTDWLGFYLRPDTCQTPNLSFNVKSLIQYLAPIHPLLFLYTC